MAVLLDIKFEDTQGIEYFSKLIDAHTIIDWHGDKGFDRAEIQYAVVWKPETGLLASLPNLKVIYSAGAGVDHIFADQELPKDIPIVRFVDPDLRDRMSEWVVLQCLMHLRQQRAYDKNQRSRNWIELPQPIASEIRVGIMGLGILGLDAAIKLKMMGFQVSGWSRSAKNIEGVDTFAGKDSFGTFLGQADILVNLLPLTDETAGILCNELFDQLPQNGAMKPVIVNAGRGGSQIEADIVEALKSGKLGGVSLDVFQSEPLSKDSPLWTIDNATLTPHVAAVSSLAALASYVAQSIAAYEDNGNLNNLVELERGY